MSKVYECTCMPKFPERICIACVGQLLNYSPRTIYAKAEAGELPSVPTSRRHRIFLRESILYWMKNKETGLAA